MGIHGDAFFDSAARGVVGENPESLEMRTRAVLALETDLGWAVVRDVIERRIEQLQASIEAPAVHPQQTYIVVMNQIYGLRLALEVPEVVVGKAQGAMQARERTRLRDEQEQA